jgi:uncharacterized Fe-S cluster-containing radical SAM superfamily protein
MIVKFPYPTNTHTLNIPDPEFSDTLRNESTVVIKRSMTNVKKTVVSKTTNNVRKYTFVLTQLKALELVKYYEDHCAVQWLMGAEHGYLKINPLAFNSIRRSAIALSNDAVTVDIEFEVL